MREMNLSWPSALRCLLYRTRFDQRDIQAELEQMERDPQEIAERRRNEQAAGENYRVNLGRLKLMRQDLADETPRRTRPDKNPPGPKLAKDEVHLAKAKQNAARRDWKVSRAQHDLDPSGSQHTVLSGLTPCRKRMT
eukprot:5513771-Prymnesium_polylepis.2